MECGSWVGIRLLLPDKQVKSLNIKHLLLWGYIWPKVYKGQTNWSTKGVNEYKYLYFINARDKIPGCESIVYDHNKLLGVESINFTQKSANKTFSDKTKPFWDDPLWYTDTSCNGVIIWNIHTEKLYIDTNYYMAKQQALDNLI